MGAGRRGGWALHAGPTVHPAHQRHLWASQIPGTDRQSQEAGMRIGIAASLWSMQAIPGVPMSSLAPPLYPPLPSFPKTPGWGPGSPGTRALGGLWRRRRKRIVQSRGSWAQLECWASWTQVSSHREDETEIRASWSS